MAQEITKEYKSVEGIYRVSEKVRLIRKGKRVRLDKQGYFVPSQSSKRAPFNVNGKNYPLVFEDGDALAIPAKDLANKTLIAGADLIGVPESDEHIEGPKFCKNFYKHYVCLFPTEQGIVEVFPCEPDEDDDRFEQPDESFEFEKYSLPNLESEVIYDYYFHMYVPRWPEGALR